MCKWYSYYISSGLHSIYFLKNRIVLTSKLTLNHDLLLYRRVIHECQKVLYSGNKFGVRLSGIQNCHFNLSVYKVRSWLTNSKSRFVSINQTSHLKGVILFLGTFIYIYNKKTDFYPLKTFQSLPKGGTFTTKLDLKN